MAFHCMNCNGSMVFDVDSQRMRCLHCGSECDPGDFVFRDESPEAAGHAFVADGQLSVYTCQNCGAELEGTEDSMIGFCPYCGGQSMVVSSRSGSAVEHIVPFQVSKQRCEELYGEYVKKVPYLPKELKDPEHIQKFTGIYMPFYQYDAQFGKAHLTGTKTVESNSRYDVINHYRIDGAAEAPYERGVSFDGSKYLDDEVSELVQPFDVHDEQPFREAYLAGFYADASTVPAELYYSDAGDQASTDLLDAMKKELKETSGISMGSDSTAEATVTGHHLALMPLWFLTWRNEDRVAYAIINGESGKVVSDMPLNLKTFAVGCAVASLVIFAVLELLFQPTPLITSFISLFAGLLMAFGIRSGAKREYEMNTHANDRGWASEGADGTAQGSRKTTRRKKGLGSSLKNRGLFFTIFMVVWVGGFIVSFAIGITSVTSKPILRWAIPIPMLIFVFYLAFKIHKWRRTVSWKEPVIAIWALIVTMVLNTAIIIISPVNDGWYYIGDAVCIAGLIIAAIGMLRVYNVSTTRPLPKLFDRAEVEQ